MWVSSLGIVAMAQGEGKGDRPFDVSRSKPHRRSRGRNSDRLPAFRFAAATIVLLLWAAMYTRALLDPSFQVPPELSAPFLLVVTWLFGSGLLSTRERDTRDD